MSISAVKARPVRSLPTVAEVARVASVSRAVVYAVLNAEKRTNIGVSEAKRKVVEKVAAELGYVRNEAARALVTGKTLTIGVVISTLKSDFYGDFFACLDDVCNCDGYSLLIGVSDKSATREARSLRTMLSKRVDAIVLGRVHPNYNADILHEFLRQQTPVLLLGEDDIPNPEYLHVAFNEPSIGKLAAEHLWSLGHRKAAYFRPVVEGDLTNRLHDMRRDSFSACWTALGGGQVRQFATANATYGGSDLARELSEMAVADRPTAVACSCDVVAISAIHALSSHGISVPGDISVIGCDDLDIASQIAVPLTTVRLPREELAQGVWRILRTSLVEDKDGIAYGSSNQLLVEPKLIVRQSTIKSVR